MHFTINREVLAKKLNIASHGLASKSPMKALEGIKLSITKEDLFITASSNELSIEVIVSDESLEVKTPGRILVPGKLFIDIIKELDSKDITLYLIEDKMLMIKADRKEYTINLYDINDYPHISFIEEKDPFEIDVKTLKKCVEQTIFACASVNNSNRMLQGVNFKLLGKNLILTSTNSYRLSQKILTLNNDYKEFELTIPSKSLETLIKTFEGLEDDVIVKMIEEKNNILFKVGDILLQSRLLDGVYPNTANIILNDCPITVTFNKEELQTAIKRVSILSPVDKERDKEISFSAISLKISQDSEVELSSTNIQGAAKETIYPIELKVSDPLKIGFSSKYLSEALRVLDDSEVVLSFVNSLKQFTIRSKNDSSLTEVILPFRLD